MKKTLAALFALIGCFAVITQFVLMVNNRAASVPETIIRFFSFFTILTNIMVALYFTALAVAKKDSVTFVNRPGTLTAITIYITTVGTVYQVVLRQVWQPTGMQLIVDELLHTII
ncbi:MAG: Pr6Pr family membrane protein, partial [Bacteroidota bacterium]|nr:Pr6Pr family membrane protein [Bacteroidota bacterium]